MVIFDNLPLYFEAFLQTLSLLLLATLFALPLGVVIAAMRISPVGSLRATATVYTEILRNTPLVLVFIFCFVVLPILGVVLPFMFSAVLALTLYTAPFFAEAIRSGVNGVPVGQAEAARSVGMTFGQTVTLVVLPQAIRSVVPPLINVMIALTKNTSIAGGFFIFELFGSGRRLINANGDQVIAVLVGVAIFYLLITIPLGQLADALERRVAIKR
ncbi:amino acid ABC transporter permease [Subtercola boreus]|uniref:Amino acid ABC transporter permease n=1 Tax=Subtercola boreus TaxID=120213 RepID=A0A3E0WEF9_9MICO|nr:amino acid ABC transporter permease [Subtercola boreus]RFA21850.1 amino acid ABC transporter permease [Subtercola boreus]RFA21961.1 amino acid ABC transporter permease [Subtercola boreus]RFA27909.1 amino acid ABC transporter permease [Subtercola boreus]